MLRVACAVFILAVAFDTAFGILSEDQRIKLTQEVIEQSGRKLPEGDEFAYSDANGMIENCGLDQPIPDYGISMSVPGRGDEFEAALSAATELADKIPDDAAHVSCDANKCDDGVLVACAVKLPVY